MDYIATYTAQGLGRAQGLSRYAASARAWCARWSSTKVAMK